MDFNGNNCDDMVEPSSSSSTLIVEGGSKILSIEIKATDEIINLPDPKTTEYDQIQYIKTVDVPRDIIFQFNGLQKGKIYNNMQQTIVFHRFKPESGQQSTWIT